jgi:mannose-6-phosphate isomerase-like protein (cupin superfamily)
MRGPVVECRRHLEGPISMTGAQPKTAVAREGYYRSADAGAAFWGPGDTYTFLATGNETAGAYFQLEALVTPGGGPPPHIHHREDETFYPIEGSVEMRLGDSTVLAGPSDYVNVPKRRGPLV